MCRSSVSKDKWETLEGKFQLSTLPDRVIFYLEGPSPGIDLLIESIVIACPSMIRSVVSILSEPFPIYLSLMISMVLESVSWVAEGRLAN